MQPLSQWAGAERIGRQEPDRGYHASIVSSSAGQPPDRPLLHRDDSRTLIRRSLDGHCRNNRKFRSTASVYRLVAG